MISLRAIAEVTRQVRSTRRTSGWLWTAAYAADQLLPLHLTGLWSERRVPAADLTAQVESILSAWGMSEEHSAITARHLVYADLHGIDSHGCAVLRHYSELLSAGWIDMTSRPEIVNDDASTAVLDGGGGLGQLPGDTAMRMAIAKGRDHGLGAVAVRNSGHFGAAGSYALMAGQAGLIGIAATTTAEPAVVPTFGTQPVLGTNPIAFCAPAEANRPFLLDMATTTVPVGKIATRSRRGSLIPRGWALGRGGRPVRVGRRALKHRRLTPLGGGVETGGHKGYGLAATVEILAGLLAGAFADHRADGGAPSVGHFFLAIDPERFRDDGGFGIDLDRLLDGLRASAPADASRPVLVAGDPEYAAERERGRLGVPVSRVVIEDLRGLARAAGVPFNLAP
jgi:LDH2 family malate/lactate/ureidoglycolate dehydrogenase